MGPIQRLVIGALVGALLAGCFGSAASQTSGPPETPGATATAGPTDSASPIDSATPMTTATPSIPPSPSMSPTTASPSPSAIPSPSRTPSPTAAAFMTYTVRAGDTLGSIAAAHGTTWQSLVYWNRDRHPTLDPANVAYNPNVIEAGWTLRLQRGSVVAYDPPPPPAPTAAPTPRPTATSAPATGTAVSNGSRTSKRVALTLDMGGRIGDALAIMTWLRDHGVPATIFMTGSMAESTTTDAGRQVLARVDARPDLFDLGNHSYSHPHMTTMSAAAMADELRRAESAIDRNAAATPRPFFRPPFGEWNVTLVNAAASVGYRFTVLWDVDTIDWKPMSDGGPTAQAIVDKVVGRAQGGSIVLMHLGGYETLKALPGIVSGLQARGLQPVTLGTLLGG